MNPLIELTCAIIEQLPNGIINVRYKADYQVELSDTIEVEKAFVELSQDNHLYITTVATSGPQLFSDDALDYLASKTILVDRIKGSALVLKGLPNRLLSRIFITFHKPKYPTKVFSNEESAVAWLHSLKVKNQD